MKVLMTLMLLCGVSSVWAENSTDTWVFVKQAFKATLNGSSTEYQWTASNGSEAVSSASGYADAKGIQTTLAKLVLTCPNTYKNVSSVVVSYSTNDKSTAKISVKAGTATSAQQQVEKSKTNVDLTFDFSAEEDNQNIVITCDKNGTAGSLYIKTIKVVYGGTSTPTPQLQSIAISGTPVKTTYYAGETFDHTGLKVTGTYDVGDPQEITNGITWSFDPEILSLGTTSVSVTAKVGEFESEPFNVNVTVTEKPALPSYTLVTDASTLMDGDVIVLGAVKDENWYANGGINTKYLDAVEAICTDGILESSEAVGITLIAVDGGWNLKIGDKYINTTAAKELTFADDASTVWTISINENVATVSAGDYGRFLYNYNNGSPRFLNYTSATSAIMLLPQIFKKKNTQTVTIKSAGYATACIPFASTVEGATAYYVTVDKKEVILNKIEGTIPAETGVVLKGEPGTATFTLSSDTPESVDGNLLVGTTKAEGETFGEATGTKYYILSTGKNGVGFYWDASTNDEGATAHCDQYKAVLAVPNTPAGTPSFFTFDDATAINGISSVKTSGVRYNLNGQAVGEDYKGIVIVNGKKMFNK